MSVLSKSSQYQLLGQFNIFTSIKASSRLSFSSMCAGAACFPLRPAFIRTHRVLSWARFGLWTLLYSACYVKTNGVFTVYPALIISIIIITTTTTTTYNIIILSSTNLKQKSGNSFYALTKKKKKSNLIIPRK